MLVELRESALVFYIYDGECFAAGPVAVSLAVSPDAQNIDARFGLALQEDGEFGARIWKVQGEDTGHVLFEGRTLQIDGEVELQVRLLSTDQGDRRLVGLGAPCIEINTGSKVVVRRTVFVGVLDDEDAFVQRLQEAVEDPPNEAEIARLPLSFEALVQVLRNQLREREPSAMITEVGPGHQVRVTRAQGRQESWLLDNLYRDLSKHSERLVEEVQWYLNVALTGSDQAIEPGDGQTAPVVPRVVASGERTLSATQRIALHGKDEDPQLFRPIAGDLWCGYAFDLPDRYQSLNESDLDRHCGDLEELHRRAVQNLWDAVPLVRQLGPDADGYIMLCADGNCEASLFLVPELWEAIDPQIKGDRLVAVPNRDMLLVTGTGHPEAIEKIRAIAAESCANGSYPIAPDLIVWDGELWRLLEP